MKWILWGCMLALTNGFSTWVSRARNTPSYGYHGSVAALNHATWFITNVIFVGVAVGIQDFHDWRTAALAWIFYVICSTCGSVSMHYISINYFETGNRRVGSYDHTEKK